MSTAESHPVEPKKKWKRKKTRSRKNRMRRDTRPKDKRPTYFDEKASDFVGHGWNKELLEEQAKASKREAEIVEGLPEARQGDGAWTVDVRPGGSGKVETPSAPWAIKPPAGKRRRLDGGDNSSSASAPPAPPAAPVGTTMTWEAKDAKQGSGAACSAGQTATIAVTGSEGTFRGTRFCSAAALSFVVGSSTVLEALSKGVIGMAVNGKRRITVEALGEPELVQPGEEKRGTAPKGTTLCFVVKLRALE